MDCMHASVSIHRRQARQRLGASKMYLQMHSLHAEAAQQVGGGERTSLSICAVLRWSVGG